MMSILEGKSLNSISYLPTTYKDGEWITPMELHITGGVVTLDDKIANIVTQYIKQAKKINCVVNDYVRYMLIEEGIL